MYLNSTLVSNKSSTGSRKERSIAPMALMSIKKCLLFLFQSMGICFFSFSQNPTVTGAILEEGSAAKIVDAIVAIEGTAFVETTDENGQFVFDEPIPQNEYVVSVSKDGYEERYFLINVIQGKKLVVDQVELKVTKKERKRRKKLKKSTQKESEKQDKKVAKETKRLKKDKKGPLGILRKKKDPVEVVYEDLPTEIREDEVEVVEVAITPLQKKYAGIIGVSPEEITNTDLYSFIEEWMGAPYLMGGESKDGIDCSSFAQRLFLAVYDELIERTAQNQMDSEATKTFAGVQFLKEGDLVFFRAAGDLSDTITHVGIYLGGKKFVNATSRTGKSGSSGVKISDLSDPYWSRRFFAGGRRVITKS